MADDFTGRYGDLLTGSYDCVDRVVLNAYFPIGHNPGGFRCWWRRLHGSDDQLDDTHLMRMPGRFARRVKVWAAANGVPVIFCKAGERKHLIAEQYLEENAVSPGVGGAVGKVLVDVSRALRLVPFPKPADAGAGAVHIPSKKLSSKLASSAGRSSET